MDVKPLHYREDIERCTAYIHSHLDEELTAEQLAGKMGYSLYHFCRVFTACKGLPPMEYIRRRRLLSAAEALCRGEKIMDTALAHGFDTPGGFAKAFRRAYGCSPQKYAALHKYKETGEVVMHMKPTWKVVQKEAFKVAGYGIETDIAKGQYTKDVAAFWENYDGENLESKLYRILEPPRHGEVGMCVPRNGGRVTYLLGVVVEDFSKAGPDMIRVEVPAAEYAVFTTTPVDTTEDMEQKAFAAVIKETWRTIFEDWFPQSGYVYDEEGMDFEFYDERCHHVSDTVMEIYIPVKKTT